MKIIKLYKKANLFQPIYWDSKDGHGAVPNNQNVDYLGFVKEMNVSDFLILSPPGFSNFETVRFIEDAIENGEPIAPPFFIADWDKENNRWLIIDHEGRSRAQAILNQYGNGIKIPVHIFPQYMRSRNITEEMKEAPFLSQMESRDLW